jgi:hypothetical protein
MLVFCVATPFADSPARALPTGTALELSLADRIGRASSKVTPIHTPILNGEHINLHAVCYKGENCVNGKCTSQAGPPLS